MKNYIILIMIFFACFVNSIQSQNRNSFNLSELSINNNNLNIIIDTLLTKEQGCIDFAPSLYWSVSLNERDSIFYIKITQTQYIGDADGYFYRDNFLFLVYGEDYEKLFKRSENTKLFYQEQKSFLIGDDYSSWYYVLLDDVISFKESYPIGCE